MESQKQPSQFSVHFPTADSSAAWLIVTWGYYEFCGLLVAFSKSSTSNF